MKKYEVAYTKGKDREFAEFTRKTDAVKFVRLIKKEGGTKIYLDTYNNEYDRNLIGFKAY